ncbi:MAG TPA: Gfo/Idh/MocA family oxidoreductase [Sulfolobales archaeon]|nr:Gfo/Idh/MocA family oxidoreductase [Sulfolobales archaeon]
MNKLGIVGAGRWGSTIATRIHETGIASISIVYDKDIERARLLAQKVGATVARDLSDFDKHKDLLGIIVATSIDSLAHVSAELIKMGFNVLIEKPVADSLDKVRMLRNLAESRRVIAIPGFVVRFDPISIWIKDRLSRGDESLEDLYLFRLSRRPPWAKVNSILLDLAIHDIDLARYLIEDDIVPISWSIHNLEIDQAFTMYAKHRGGSVFINVDGVSKNKVRKAIVSLTKSYIEGDYVNQYIINRSEGGEHDHIKIKGTEALVKEITVFMEKCRGADVEAPTLLDAEKAHEIINHVLPKKS